MFLKLLFFIATINIFCGRAFCYYLDHKIKTTNVTDTPSVKRWQYKPSSVDIIENIDTKTNNKANQQNQVNANNNKNNVDEGVKTAKNMSNIQKTTSEANYKEGISNNDELKKYIKEYIDSYIKEHNNIISNGFCQVRDNDLPQNKSNPDYNYTASEVDKTINIKIENVTICCDCSKNLDGSK